jgi:hypothetical protein
MENPRILMLIIANDDGGLYSKLQEFWLRYMNSEPAIDCYFIKGRESQTEPFVLEENSLYIKTREGYAENDALWVKTIEAFRYFQPRFHKYDFMFRTNLSSFIRFDKYIEFCKTLPRVNLYSGPVVTGYGVRYASGCGFTLSIDLAERLLADPPTHHIIDDITFGKAFQNWNIPIKVAAMHTIQPVNLDAPDTSSMDELYSILQNPGDVYHIRVRTGNEGRLQRDIYIHDALYRRFYCDPMTLGHSTHHYFS